MMNLQAEARSREEAFAISALATPAAIAPKDGAPFLAARAKMPAAGPRRALPRLPRLEALEPLQPLHHPPRRMPAPDDNITQMSYVRMFIADKLTFPPDPADYNFTHADLKDEGFIGCGRYGNVHRMLHTGTQRPMAVKRVRIISNRNDEQETASMRSVNTEVEAIRRASDCPQIVQFFGVTFHEGDCWVCMELMDSSLEGVYKAVHSMEWRFFDEVVLGSVAVSTIKALDHLKQNHHIIHRDVKPSNILLNKAGQVKLCDFGISGYLVDSVAMTLEVGCRPYMAPERLLASAEGYSIKSDVWSLGITMVEVCTGAFPYHDFVDMPVFEQLRLVVYGDAPLLQKPEYSSPTRNFINACLVKEVEHRPDFQQLMETDYFKHYESMPLISEHVANFVQKVLPHVPVQYP